MILLQIEAHLSGERGEGLVTNYIEYMLDNVKFEVSYIKKNGEVWRNKEIDTDMIGPKMYVTFKAPDTVRGTSVRVRIKSVKSDLLGLY